VVERTPADGHGARLDRALYLQRARENNDEQDYVRAEQSARASLGLRSQRNGGAFVVLVSALLA
jgi:hypothetical protein